MAHSDETRRAVRAGYVFDQLALETAADAQAVPVATARRWKSDARKAGDDWDKARAAQELAGGSLEDVLRQTLAVIVRQTQATMDAIEGATDMPPAAKVQAMASLADSYNKLLAAARRLMPETDQLGVAMGVVQLLLDFVRKNYPQHGAAIAEVLEPFGEEVTKAYG